MIKWNSKFNFDFNWVNINQVSGGGDFTLLVDPNDDNGTAYLAYGLPLLHDETRSLFEAFVLPQ